MGSRWFAMFEPSPRYLAMLVVVQLIIIAIMALTMLGVVAMYVQQAKPFFQPQKKEVIYEKSVDIYPINFDSAFASSGAGR